MGNTGRKTIRSLLMLAAVILIPATSLGHGSASVAEIEDRAIEFPDTAEFMTLIVDLHTHSVFSDGHVWPNIRVAEALRDGLDAIAITEHLEWQPHLEDIPHPDRNRSYNVAVESNPEGSDLIIIAGSEITRRAPHGHMNAVFVHDANALVRVGAVPEPFDAREYYVNSTVWTAQEVLDAANEQGAFTFWNHSWSNFTNAKTEILEFHRANAANGKLHGIEVANGRTYSAESFQIALDHNLTLIGVSDVHNLIDWDYQPHNGGHRPVNLVFVQERSAEAIREALFARRTVVWYKNLLIGRPLELLPLLQASLSADHAAYRPATEVLEVTLANHSDAKMMLRNLTGFSIGEHDIIEVPAHGEKTLYIRTGERLEDVTLSFEVLNALITPNAHPILEYSLEIDDPGP